VARLLKAAPFIKPLRKIGLTDWVDKKIRFLFSLVLLKVLPNPLKINDVFLYWRPHDPVIMEFVSGYEPDTVQYLKSIKPTHFVDIGAHYGFYSLLMARHVGQKGKVYAFEPDPSNYKLLLMNIKVNNMEDIIMPVNKAVSDRSGVITFFPGKESCTGSLYASRYTMSKSITVETVTLDEFFEHEGWPAIDVIKIDIQGAEKVALEGIKKMSARNPDLKLIIEFSPATLTDAGVSVQEFFDKLLELGFQKFSVLQNGIQPINIPSDISRLVRMAKREYGGYLNLLCER
jgi:FkbM family methyltransferase